jgi:serine/threonine-protein kinase HipA
LFTGNYETESFAANGYYAFDDFYQLGMRVGLPEAIVKREIAQLQKTNREVDALVQRSFLDEDVKNTYIELFRDKLIRLNYSFESIAKQRN